MDEVLKYLSTIASPSTIEAAAEFNALMVTCNSRKLIVLWPYIKEAVENGFFEEFHTIFGSKQDPRFIGIIGLGRFILGQYERLGTVSTLQKQFSASDGYRQSMYQMFRSSSTFFSSKDRLIERRHDNPLTQELYDREFGLVLT